MTAKRAVWICPIEQDPLGVEGEGGVVKGAFAPPRDGLVWVG